MFIGTYGFYHFIPLSVTLTLAGGHKVSTKQNLLASFSYTSQLNGIKFGVVMKQFKLNILRLLLSEIYVITVKYLVSAHYHVSAHPLLLD